MIPAIHIFGAEGARWPHEYSMQLKRMYRGAQVPDASGNARAWVQEEGNIRTELAS